MDSSQRVVVGTLGGGLMVGGIAWANASISSAQAWYLRILPPVAMFVVGVALVIWAMRSTPNSRRAILKRAIRDGRELLGQGESVWAVSALSWQNTTVARLREHVGEAAAYGLEYPPQSEGGVAGRLRAQVAYLEGLRKRR